MFLLAFSSVPRTLGYRYLYILYLSAPLLCHRAKGTDFFPVALSLSLISSARWNPLRRPRSRERRLSQKGSINCVLQKHHTCELSGPSGQCYRSSAQSSLHCTSQTAPGHQACWILKLWILQGYRVPATTSFPVEFHCHGATRNLLTQAPWPTNHL